MLFSSSAAATYMVAIMSMEISMMLGVPAVSGSELSTWLMAEDTFTMAESMSVPSSNSRNTMA